MVFAAGPAFAISDHIQVVSVENARQFRNASEIVIEGKIVRHEDDDKYVFTDDTGSIVVKITPEKMRELDLESGDRVRIRGEIERTWFGRPSVGAIEAEVIR